MNSSNGNLEMATIGGGCFWCLEPIFDELKGIENVEVGYSGGQVPHPTYEQVCDGNTGHAEVVNISFRSEEISFEELLHVFFSIHDPTTPNRQGSDVGFQYRSIILYHTEEQKRVADRVIRDMEEKKLWKDPIVTEIEPYTTFYKAEAFHQDYFKNNQNNRYCQLVIAPKVAQYRKAYSSNERNE